MFGFGKKRKLKKELEAKRRLEATQKEKTKTSVQEETEAKEEVVEEPKKERKMSYHITKHPKGGWQIKKGKAERALKRFDTQKAAIEYAKELEKTGASFIIHKSDGSTRKKTY